LIHFIHLKQLLFNKAVPITKMISIALLLDPGLVLALSECKQWQSCLFICHSEHLYSTRLPE